MARKQQGLRRTGMGEPLSEPRFGVRIPASQPNSPVDQPRHANRCPRVVRRWRCVCRPRAGDRRGGHPSKGGLPEASPAYTPTVVTVPDNKPGSTSSSSGRGGSSWHFRNQPCLFLFQERYHLRPRCICADPEFMRFKKFDYIFSRQKSVSPGVENIYQLVKVSERLIKGSCHSASDFVVFKTSDKVRFDRQNAKDIIQKSVNMIYPVKSFEVY